MEESSNQTANFHHFENLFDEEGENEEDAVTMAEAEAEGFEGQNTVLENETDCRNNGFSSVVTPPSVGMVFPTWKDVDVYYKRYGRQEGFRVVRSSGAYKQLGGQTTRERRNYSWRCECNGRADRRRRVNGKRVVVGEDAIPFASRKSKKCDCPAMMYATASKEGEWEVKKIVVEHNHKLTPCLDELPTHEENKPLIDHALGVNIPQNHSSLGISGLENMGFCNVIDQERRLKLRDGDANAMLKIFSILASDNQNFFHMYRLDQFGGLKDVMWVDARSRVAYEEFGDVVWFDSTYFTNEYELPLVTFVGVNHHGQSILFGCALISQGNVDTYQWLFSTWLLCMGGKAPIGILTDQDAAMRQALSVVMPQSRHRWCLWLMLKKFAENLGTCGRYKDFKEVLHNAIYDSLTPKEFEDSWSSAVKDFGLESNDWLAGLFQEREMWVPAYMKQFFWAGMRTTQHVGSISSFFDRWLKKDTRLFEFASQYCEVMESKVNDENGADANASRYIRQLITEFPVEGVFQKLYTDAKFKELQLECTRILYINGVEKKVVSDHVVEYTLEDRVWVLCTSTRKEYPTKKRRNYKVVFNLECNKAWCDCKLFECHGIMCRHLIKVFDIYDITEVPEMYILRRWRKDIQRKYTQLKVAYHNPSKTKEVQRYEKMMAAFESVCLKASASEDNLNIAMELIQLMDIRLDEINVMGGRSQNADSLTRTPSHVGNNRFLNNKNATSASKGFENCTKRKEMSPPTEQESYTQDLSSSSTQYIKNPVSWKKANNTCEVSVNLEPSNDMPMVDQPLNGKLIPNLFMDNRQVGSTYQNTVEGEVDLRSNEQLIWDD